MQVTTKMLNNKVDLSSEAKTKLETRVKNEVKNEAKAKSETKAELEAKVKLDALLEFVEDFQNSLDGAILAIVGITTPDDMRENGEKRGFTDEKVDLAKLKLAKESPRTAAFIAVVRAIREGRQEDRSTFEGRMANDLHSLLGNITADINEADASDIEAYLKTLNAYKDSLQSVQADFENVDPEMAITKYKGQESSLQACLAMEPNIFQPTLSDYLS